VGDRLFDIVVEDELVYSRFDQVEAAGGSGIAVVRSVVTDVEDGELSVLFVNRRANNPAVKALEVLRALEPGSSTTTTTLPTFPSPTTTSTLTTPAPTSTTLAAPTTTMPATTTTTSTTSTSTTSTSSTSTTLPDRSTDADNDGLPDFDDACPLDASNVCFGNVATDALTGLPIRVNANPDSAFCSGVRIDCRGDRWQGDFGYVEAGKGWACSGDGRWGRCDINAVADALGCESSDTRDVFRCAHAASDNGGRLAYVFRVAPGRYLVNLYFANIRWSDSDRGSQLTDISINGDVVYPGFDKIAAARGSGTLAVRSAYVSISAQDDLVIELSSVVGRASINGLEVLRAAGP
jgi:hypothetical protein